MANGCRIGSCERESFGWCIRVQVQDYRSVYTVLRLRAVDLPSPQLATVKTARMRKTSSRYERHLLATGRCAYCDYTFETILLTIST